jgi:hypothetical protein
MVALNLDPRAYVPEFGGGNFVLWPKGWIKVAVTASDWKPTRGNDGSVFLELKITALENPQGATADIVGTENTIRLNLGNKGKNAESTIKRAASEGAALAYACGFTAPVQTSEQLHNIPFWVEAEHETQKGTEGRPDFTSNRFKAYRRIDGADPMDIARQVGGLTSNTGAAPVPQPAQAPGFAPGAPAQAPGPGPGPGPGPAPAGAPPFAAPAAQAPNGSAPPFANGPAAVPAQAPQAAPQAPAWQQQPAGAAPNGAATPAPGGAPWGNR